MPGSYEVQQLRDLLLAPEVSALNKLERSIAALDQQIHNPEELRRLLAPIVEQVLQHGDPALSLALIEAITPLLDRGLREKVAQDAVGMSAALAPTSTSAIAKHFVEAPEEAARDLAPLMSAAIKEEIRGERDAMIDALYPVIGSTISKYLSETFATLIRTINEKIEARFSAGSIVRKIRARLTGVSEGELLMRESLPLRVEAAFLIHKRSGLIIAQFQNPQLPPLDPDLLSGMLTAIRDFFNESMNGTRDARQLDQIAYGESKIVLEVAGYCYLAAIVRGTPDDSFRNFLRTTMATIVQQHGSAIAAFAGDSATVSGDLGRTIQEMVRYLPGAPKDRTTRMPYAVILAGCILVLAIGIPLAVSIYKNHMDAVAEDETTTAFLSARPSPLRDITVHADRGTLHLFGRVPNEYQRDRAVKIALAASPGLTVDNRLIPDVETPFPQITNMRTNEMVSTLNTIDGICLEASFHDGDLRLTGAVADSSLLEKIERTFEVLPGLRSFQMHCSAGDMEVGRRLYFSLGSVQIRPADRVALESVKTLVDRTPWSRLLVSGYSDDVGGQQLNRRIAWGRATNAETALRSLGIPPRRIVVQGTPGPPPGNSAAGADSLSRCVRFVLLRTSFAETK